MAVCPWPPLPNLFLVGVVHGDPQGYVRAWRLLDYLRPDLITVEISRFSLRYRQRWKGHWRRLLAEALENLPVAARGHLAIRRLAAQVDLPFEVRAARDWGLAHGIPWRPLDLSAPARRHLPRYGTELLSAENLRALLTTPDGPLADFVAAEFSRARRAWGRSPWRLASQNHQETLAREWHLARRLKRLACRYRRLVHLGGWEHLVPWQDSGGLWHALAELRPRRLLLDEADTPAYEGASPEKISAAPPGPAPVH